MDRKFTRKNDSDGLQTNLDQDQFCLVHNLNKTCTLPQLKQLLIYLKAEIPNKSPLETEMPYKSLSECFLYLRPIIHIAAQGSSYIANSA